MDVLIYQLPQWHTCIYNVLNTSSITGFNNMQYSLRGRPRISERGPQWVPQYMATGYPHARCQNYVFFGKIMNFPTVAQK